MSRVGIEAKGGETLYAVMKLVYWVINTQEYHEQSKCVG